MLERMMIALACAVVVAGCNSNASGVVDSGAGIDGGGANMADGGTDAMTSAFIACNFPVTVTPHKSEQAGVCEAMICYDPAMQPPPCEITDSVLDTGYCISSHVTTSDGPAFFVSCDASATDTVKVQVSSATVASTSAGTIRAGDQTAVTGIPADTDTTIDFNPTGTTNTQELQFQFSRSSGRPEITINALAPKP